MTKTPITKTDTPQDHRTRICDAMATAAPILKNNRHAVRRTEAERRGRKGVIQVGRVWKRWAYRYEGALWHVGARRWVELHGLDHPLVPVLVEEILGDRYAAEVTHYGWEDREADARKDTPAMIQVRAGQDPKKALMFLSMCVSIGRADGDVVALRITESPLVVCEECNGLRADKKKLADEIRQLRTEVDRLNTLNTPRPATQPSTRDDSATRFSLLELD